MSPNDWSCWCRHPWDFHDRDGCRHCACGPAYRVYSQEQAEAWMTTHGLDRLWVRHRLLSMRIGWITDWPAHPDQWNARVVWLDLPKRGPSMTSRTFLILMTPEQVEEAVANNAVSALAGL